MKTEDAIEVIKAIYVEDDEELKEALKLAVKALDKLTESIIQGEGAKPKGLLGHIEEDVEKLK